MKCGKMLESTRIFVGNIDGIWVALLLEMPIKMLIRILSPAPSSKNLPTFSDLATDSL